jgi:hypothetical protein
MDKPLDAHLAQAERTLQYLQNYPNVEMEMLKDKHEDVVFSAWSDSDW